MKILARAVHRYKVNTELLRSRKGSFLGKVLTSVVNYEDLVLICRVAVETESEFSSDIIPDVECRFIAYA